MTRRMTPQGCSRDNYGDGNCMLHPAGCAPALEKQLLELAVGLFDEAKPIAPSDPHPAPRLTP